MIDVNIGGSIPVKAADGPIFQDFGESSRSTSRKRRILHRKCKFRRKRNVRDMLPAPRALGSSAAMSNTLKCAFERVCDAYPRRAKYMFPRNVRLSMFDESTLARRSVYFSRPRQRPAYNDGGSSEISRSVRVCSKTARSSSASSGVCWMPRRANILFWIRMAWSTGHSVICPKARA